MKTNEYLTKFRELANNTLSPKEIEICLEYANNLLQKDLPVIYDMKHLSLLTKYNTSFLYLCMKFKEKVYREFSIKKRNGTDRSICEPLPNLKNIQIWIKENILEKLPTHKAAKAFIKQQSIKKNAYFHKDQNIVIALDIKDFFNNISGKTVYFLFRRCGYSRRVSSILTELCTFKNCLPQGAPTSPLISNLIFSPIDNRIFNFARKEKLFYTRYADDITISGSNIKIKKILSFINMILQENHFELNADKIKIMRKNTRQFVTGIVTNGTSLRAPKDTIKKLRQEIYYIKKYGLDEHMNHCHIKQAHYIEHLIGIANFILFINKSDSTASEAIQFLKSLQQNKDY